MDAFEAYHFIFNHPNCVEEDPEHPIYRDPHSPEYNAAPLHQRMWMWQGQFIHALSYWYVKVNPETLNIDEDESLNTRTRVWFETGPAYWNEYTNSYQENMHDPKLDCGGDTFEEALIKLAELIKEHYGDYEPTA